MADDGHDVGHVHLVIAVGVAEQDAGVGDPVGAVPHEHRPTLYVSGSHLLRRDLVAFVLRGIGVKASSSVLAQAADECLHARRDLVAVAVQC